MEMPAGRRQRRRIADRGWVVTISFREVGFKASMVWASIKNLLVGMYSNPSGTCRPIAATPGDVRQPVCFY